MPSTFADFNTPKAELLRYKSPSIQEGSETVVAIVKARIIHTPKAGEPAKAGGNPPPIRYSVLLINEVTLKRFLTKDEKKTMGLPADTKPAEPVTFAALSTHKIGIFGGNPNLTVGGAYEFLGASYNVYKKDEDSDAAISIKAVSAKPYEFDVRKMFRDQSYSMRCIKNDDRPSMFAVPIEQQLETRKADVAAMGDSILIGQLQLPTEFGGENLVRSYGDVTKGQPVRNDISWTAGKGTGNSYLDPFALVFQSTGGSESGDTIPIQFYCETSAFDAFMFTIYQCVVPAPRADSADGRCSGPCCSTRPRACCSARSTLTRAR